MQHDLQWGFLDTLYTNGNGDIDGYIVKTEEHEKV